MVKKFQKEFISYCNSQQLEVNSNQIEVVKRLEQYYQENFKSYFLNLFSKKTSKKGFYLFGDVGVGKTMILIVVFWHSKPSVANRNRHISRVSHRIATAVFRFWIVEDILDFNRRIFGVISEL